MIERETYEERFRRISAEVDAQELIVKVDRQIRRDGWIINTISFLLCFPLGWLLSRLM